MRHIVMICLVLTLNAKLTAQQIVGEDIFKIPDTAKTFPISTFYKIILDHHPIAKQSALLSENARQEIRLARGGFDPKLEASYLLKQYDNKEYYRLFDGSVKIPTASPVTPVIGVERNTGENLNPENYISDQFNYRQLYAGIAVPLGRGLLTDERRTSLRQAELFKDLMEAEQVKVINKLLLEAAKDYWEWYFSYYRYQLAVRNVQLAEDIFRRVQFSYDGGELAPVDTLQSKITVIERQVNKQEALNDLKNSVLKISNYLWDSLSNPLEVPVNIIPVAESPNVANEDDNLHELVEQAKTNHPELRKLQVKLSQLELDRKLTAEYLKPRFDLSYYILDQPFTPEGNSTDFAFDNNFKLGLDFSFPIFLRKERAKMALTKLKITNTSLERDLARREIINEIYASYNQLVNNRILLQQQEQMVLSYGKLIEAELLNLDNGESDLFKINIQQEKLYNAQLKRVKSIAEYQKQKAILYWSAGVAPVYQ